MIPIADSNPAGKFPFWVITIILANLYVFYLELTSPNPEAFINGSALIPSLVDFSRFETLTPFITSQFLHAGFLHIISNMWFLWVFGDNVEASFGRLLFPIIYLLSGIAGGLVQYFFTPTSQIPMLGASGAVAGILGAYFALFPHHSVKTIVPIFGFFTIADLPATLMLFYWLITQIFAGTFSIVVSSYSLGGVAYFAHIGGFFFGFLAAKLLTQNSAQRLEELED